VDHIRIAKATETVQLCISSNGSTDDTDAVVASFCDSGVAIKYHKHPVTMGFSKNLITTIEIADGEYILMAADDDLLNDDALESILRVLDTNCDIALFQTWANGILLAKAGNPSSMRIKDAVHLVETFGEFHLACMGNIVVRRDLYLKHNHDFFQPSAYPHTCTVLTALRHVEAMFFGLPIYAVDDSHRKHNYPLLTSVDMSRVYTECLLQYVPSKVFINRVYMTLVRSVPRAVLKEKQGLATRNKANPYADLSLSNLMQCYRCSKKYQLIAATLWITAKLLPGSILNLLLKREGAESTAS
jgi:glycosyltransferase involved in cell wall biosynthesis